ncbi:MAG: divalent-cation tolerance protein CutA [Verrucomicrobia bacterium]|nr:divalent-cation tolerance protein CutA [Verrucomicrobiota bacterium]
MKKSAKHAVVFVTAPEIKTARRLAQAALKARLAACANLGSNLESHYWWQGKLETSSECLIIFKTRTACLARLEKLIVEKHPYDTPEFVVLPLQAGNKRYLEWIDESVRPST